MFDEKIETLQYQNHVVSNGNLASTNPNSAKKSKESERSRRRSNQKKKSKAPDASGVAAAANGDDSDATNDDCGDAKENADSQQVVKQVVIKYVLGLFPLLNFWLIILMFPKKYIKKKYFGTRAKLNKLRV